jgi:hypothetical protein
MKNDFESIPSFELDAIVGGMQWGHFPRSSNVEDVRGMSPGQAASAFPNSGGGPLPATAPGDLGSQLGRERIGRPPVVGGGGGGGGW